MKTATAILGWNTPKTNMRLHAIVADGRTLCGRRLQEWWERRSEIGDYPLVCRECVEAAR